MTAGHGPIWSLSCLALAAALLLPAPTALSADPQIIRTALSRADLMLHADGMLTDPRGPAYAPRLGPRGLALAAAPPGDPSPTVTDPDRLPDGLVARGTNRIRACWLTEPTDRYGHGVLGDAIEAGGLTMVLDDGRALSLTLPEDSVFEDRTCRLGDLDGDGRDEALVVRALPGPGRGPGCGGAPG